MTNTTKMTYAVALSSAIACDALSAEVREKLSALLTQVEKRHEVVKKPTAKQMENVGFKADIVGALSEGQQMTVSEMIKGIPSLAEISNQRVSAVVRQMVDEGILIREEIKRKAYFSLKVAE